MATPETLGQIFEREGLLDMTGEQLADWCRRHQDDAPDINQALADWICEPGPTEADVDAAVAEIRQEARDEAERN